MRHINDIILNEVTVTADKTSEVVTLNFIQDVAIQIVWSSTTCAGSIIPQVSNDRINWVNLASITNSYGVIVSAITKTVNNNNGNEMVVLNDANYAYIRVFFDYTSGTLDSLQITLNAKGC